MQQSTHIRFEVAILGTHLTGAVLATVLARHGVRVLLIDADPAAGDIGGETTVPYTAEVFATLAARFDVPEVAGFGLTAALPSPLRRASGVKRSIGLLYHQPGQKQHPEQALQFNVPGEHSEWHPYRPQVDEYAVTLACGRGAVLPDGRASVDSVRAGADGVELMLRDGSIWHTRYVVDAAGSGSPLLKDTGLEESEPRQESRSRVLATHMSGVVPFEETVDLSCYATATPWSLGTLNHLFPGGWLQIAHFGNGPDPVNPLSSVVLSVDEADGAGLPDDPDGAFRAVVGRYPSLAPCFSGARPQRPWSGASRWQRSVSRTIGDRWFLFDRSASRNDLFLSREVTVGAELVHALAPALIAAAQADDWSPDRFREAAQFQEDLEVFHDRLLAGARAACGDFRLTNAFARVWLLWSMLGALSLKCARRRCHVESSWAAVQEIRGPFWFALPSGLPELINEALDEILAAGRGERPAGQAADAVFAALRRAPFIPPVYRFGDPTARYYHFSRLRRLRMLAWSRTAPAPLRGAMTRENLTSVPPHALA